MTTATAKPPSPKAATKGNVPVDLKQLAGTTPGVGLGRAMLVRGEVKAGYVVGGALSGIPSQQLVSQVGLQQVLKLGPVLSDGIVAGAGVGIHLLARSSFTLGLAFSWLAPFAATGTQYAINWIAKLIRPAPAAAPASGGATMTGQKALGERGPVKTIDTPNIIQNIRARAG